MKSKRIKHLLEAVYPAVLAVFCYGAEYFILASADYQDKQARRFRENFNKTLEMLTQTACATNAYNANITNITTHLNSLIENTSYPETKSYLQGIKREYEIMPENPSDSQELKSKALLTQKDLCLSYERIKKTETPTELAALGILPGAIIGIICTLIAGTKIYQAIKNN